MKEATLDTWTSLFLLAAAQGFFLTVILLRKSKGDKANIPLSGVVVVFSLTLCYYVGSWTGFNRNLPSTIHVLNQLILLIGPLLFFYSKMLVGRKLTGKDYWHLAPFLIISGLAVLNSLQPYPTYYSSIVHSSVTIFKNLHLILYNWLILSLVYKADQQVSHESRSWLLRLVVLLSLFTLSFASYYVMVWGEVLKVEYDYVVAVVMSSIIYYIGYYGYRHSVIFNRAKMGKIYQKSTLTDHSLEVLYQKVYTHLRSRKSYLQNDLRLADLAHEIGIGSHQLAQIIHQKAKASFPDFINKFRIEDAKALMKDPDLRETKIIHIAYGCGFNDKVSFNNAFKKFTGVSPSEYKAYALAGRQSQLKSF